MVKITMLNSMASADFIESLEQQHIWGVTALDLKDRIFGKAVIDLTPSEAREAKREMARRGMSVYCLSTTLLHDDIEKGEAYFRERHMARLRDALGVAGILEPTLVRLLSARSGLRHTFVDSPAYIEERHPWLLPLYREAVDAIAAAGFAATIENECRDNLLARPEDVGAFFDRLDRRGNVSFTYDVQNLWEMGTYPTLSVYRQLSPYIGYLHLKGGRADRPGGPLAWKSALEDADWPVLDMTRQAVSDGVSPVICLNPSHGERAEGCDYSNIAKRDLDFIRRHIPEVE